MRRSLKLLAALSFFMAGISAVSAQQVYTWADNGEIDGQSPTAWIPNGIPGPEDHAIIEAGTAHNLYGLGRVTLGKDPHNPPTITGLLDAKYIEANYNTSFEYADVSADKMEISNTHFDELTVVNVDTLVMNGDYFAPGAATIGTVFQYGGKIVGHTRNGYENSKINLMNAFTYGTCEMEGVVANVTVMEGSLHFSDAANFRATVTAGAIITMDGTRNAGIITGPGNVYTADPTLYVGYGTPPPEHVYTFGDNFVAQASFNYVHVNGGLSGDYLEFLHLLHYDQSIHGHMGVGGIIVIAGYLFGRVNILRDATPVEIDWPQIDINDVDLVAGPDSIRNHITSTGQLNFKGHITVDFDQLGPGRLLEIARCDAGCVYNGTISATGDVAPGTQVSVVQTEKKLYLLSHSGGQYTFQGTEGTGNDAGWRMITLPQDLVTRAVLEDDLTFKAGPDSMLMRWVNDAWVPMRPDEILEVGHGMLLYLFDDDVDPVSPNLTIDVPEPNTILNDTEAIGLGLNNRFELMGNPFVFDVDLSDLSLPASGFQNNVQYWDSDAGRFGVVNADDASSNDVIHPWQGFFIERSVRGEGQERIFFPGIGAFGTIHYSLQGEGGTVRKPVSIPLTLESYGSPGQPARHEGAMHLYLHASATPGWDAYDASRIPAPGSDAGRKAGFVVLRNGSPTLLAQDSRPFPGTDTLRAELVVAGIAGAASLSWTMPPDSLGLSARLYDRTAGALVDMSSQDTYRFTSTASEAEGSLAARFEVTVFQSGLSTPAEAPSEALASGIEAVYPNPASMSVTIRFQLDERADVRLEVYDVLGREVLLAADGPYTAGTHTVVAPTGALASGTYLIRMTTGKGVFVRSLVVTH